MTTIREIQASLPHPEPDLFRSRHHPYYIFSLEYRQSSAGLRAYYQLCHVLNELGYEAYVAADSAAPGLRTPVLTRAIRERHRAEGRRPIAVYGETTRGNPLQGAVVVRWMLNRVGHIGPDPRFDADDLLFYWSAVYADGDETVPLLKLPIVDRRVFHREGVDDAKREGFCYFASKYFSYGNKQAEISERIRARGISLCKDIRRSHAEIADILRRAKVLYCYEPSAIIDEARLCGCPVVVVQTDYLADFGGNWGFDHLLLPEEEIDLDAVPDFNEAFLTWYAEAEGAAWRTIGDFIARTQEAGDDAGPGAAPDALASFCEEHRPLYIYGTGYVARHCARVMKILGAKVRGFVESDDFAGAAAEGARFRGLPVRRLSAIEPEAERAGLILAMLVKNQEAVIPELERRGFRNFIPYSLLLY